MLLLNDHYTEKHWRNDYDLNRYFSLHYVCLLILNLNLSDLLMMNLVNLMGFTFFILFLIEASFYLIYFFNN
jgi:hypothetical protein